jgi:hypothetical protein
MADNTTLNVMTGGDVIASDDITGVKYQVVKIALGAADAVDMHLDSGQQTMANSLPVAIASNQGSLPVADDSHIADSAAFTQSTSHVMPDGYLVDDTSPDVLSEHDIGAARITTDRKCIVAIGEAGANFVRGGGAKTDTTDQSIMAAPGSGYFNYLCWIALYNSSVTNTYVSVKEGSNVVAVIPLPAYGGAVVSFPTPIRGADNAVIYLASGASVTTAQLYGGGYKGR